MRSKRHLSYALLAKRSAGRSVKESDRDKEKGLLVLISAGPDRYLLKVWLQPTHVDAGQSRPDAVLADMLG